MSDNKANYIEDANRTKSTSYYPAKVSRSEFLRTLNSAITALNKLDKIKKALFYGKPLFPGDLPVIGDTCETLAIEHLHGLHHNIRVDILHGIIGKATEGCELLEALERSVITGTTLDFVNVAEEIDDGQWYDAVLAKAIGVTFEEVQTTNIAKLRKRYPEKYADAEALTRDIDSERATLESGVHCTGHVDYEQCYEAPKGWLCTRKAGHDGPCAAVSNVSVSGVAFVAHGQFRDERTGQPDNAGVDYSLCDGVED